MSDNVEESVKSAEPEPRVPFTIESVDIDANPIVFQAKAY